MDGTLAMLPHILAGMIAILAGGVALVVRKGGAVHRRYGTVFVYAMMVMTGAAAFLAARKFEIPLQRGNFVAAVLVFYLVATSLLTIRRRVPEVRWYDRAGMLVPLAIGLVVLKWGLDAAVANGSLLGFPQTPSIILGAVALCAAAGDIRLMLGRALDTPHRIVRHLWRMSFAMFAATGSFFLGQAKVLPEAIRILPLLAVPVILVLLAMFYWWARVLVTKRVYR